MTTRKHLTHPRDQLDTLFVYLYKCPLHYRGHGNRWFANLWLMSYCVFELSSLEGTSKKQECWCHTGISTKLSPLTLMHLTATRLIPFYLVYSRVQSRSLHSCWSVVEKIIWHASLCVEKPWDALDVVLVVVHHDKQDKLMNCLLCHLLLPIPHERLWNLTVIDFAVTHAQCPSTVNVLPPIY